MVKNMKFPKFVRFVCIRELKCLDSPPPLAKFISERYKQVLQHGTGCFVGPLVTLVGGETPPSM